jgi:hypothetical protein
MSQLRWHYEADYCLHEPADKLLIQNIDLENETQALTLVCTVVPVLLCPSCAPERLFR